jgi:hypothetical protein
MSTIVTRSGKGSPLTHVEVDANFTNLNTDKIQSGNTVAALTITSATVTDLAVTGITSFDGAQGTAGQVLTSAGTGNTPTWATVSGSISVTGSDLTLSGNTGTAITNATLATVNSNTGSFGSTTSIPVITVNGKGLITAVSTATVSSLPSQTGNSGKYLTTDGTTASWGAVGGGQYFGAAATKAIAYNSTSIAENITTTSGNNCLSVGPITIASGFSVTVASGQRWLVL